MKIFGWSPLLWKGNKQCKHRNKHVCLRDWRVTIKTKQRKGKVKTLRTTLKETGKIRKKITVYNRKRIHRGVRESKWQGKDNESELTKVGFEREASLISGSLSNVGFCFLFCFLNAFRRKRRNFICNVITKGKLMGLPKPRRCLEICVCYNKANMWMNPYWFHYYIFAITSEKAAKAVEIFRGSGKKYEW